jgi:hypothetical protein
MFVHKGTCHTPTQSSSDDIEKMGLAAGNGGWLCQHRYTAFTGMVGFSNFVGSQGMTDWVSSGDQRIGFGRGAFPFFYSLLFLFVLIRGMIRSKVRQGLWLSTTWTRRGPPHSRPRCRVGRIAMSLAEVLVQIQVRVRVGGVQGHCKLFASFPHSLFPSTLSRSLPFFLLLMETGYRITVHDGLFDVTIKPRYALAIHGGAMPGHSYSQSSSVFEF